jgi:hypothetical protein
MGKTNESNDKSPTGTAYAFYQSHKPKDDNYISEELIPWIREYTNTRPELTLDLITDMEELDTQNDSALAEKVNEAKQAKMNRVLKATFPSEENSRVAEYLGDIMNGICEDLYPGVNNPSMDVIHKNGKEYILLE